MTTERTVLQTCAKCGEPVVTCSRNSGRIYFAGHAPRRHKYGQGKVTRRCAACSYPYTLSKAILDKRGEA